MGHPITILGMGLGLQFDACQHAGAGRRTPPRRTRRRGGAAACGPKGEWVCGCELTLKLASRASTPSTIAIEQVSGIFLESGNFEMKFEGLRSEFVSPPPGMTFSRNILG